MSYMKEKFHELHDKRAEVISTVKTEERKLDDKGHSRFKKDLKSVEESIEQAKEKERMRAAESHLRLKIHMENKDKKREELI